jgi:hypothetical protein
MHRAVVLLLVIGLGMLALPSGAAEPVDAAHIKKLIEQLGSDDFADREKATASLDTMGEPALEELRKARLSSDNEVRRRSEDLVKKIEKRVHSAQVLAARRVHLVYKDTPLAEAVADFSKKSSYRLNLLDPEGKLKDRTITLDTGDATFWQAFDLFCQKGGLVEAEAQDILPLQPGVGRPAGRVAPVPPVAPPAREAAPPRRPGRQAPAQAKKEATPPPPVEVIVEVVAPPDAPAVAPPPIPAAPRAALIAQQAALRASQSTEEIFLKAGKPATLPTDARSAMRVRALPRSDRAAPVGEGELVVDLEATPEPRLQWQTLESLRIVKAVDDQGQNLSEMVQTEVPPLPGAVGVAVPGLGRAMTFSSSQRQIASVHLKKGARAARSLKELQGVLSAQVLTEPKALIRVDKVLDAGGKTVKGAEGGSIKVLQVKREANDSITVQFEMDMPPNTVAQSDPRAMPALLRPAINIRPAPIAPPGRPQLPPGALQVGGPAPPQRVVGGAIIMNPPISSNSLGITLEDDKGAPLPNSIAANYQNTPQGLMAVYHLNYRPEKTHGQPARLVFTGRKAASIDIPFLLKDIPLP